MTPKFYIKDKNSEYGRYKIKYLSSLTDKLIEEASRSYQKRMFIIGSSDRCNVGDQAIGIAERQIFNSFFSKDYQFFEITGDQYRFDRKRIIKLINKDDIVFIHGGGNLGTLWMHEEILNRDIIKTFKDNLIIVLPQTLYLDDSKEAKKTKKIYSSHKRLYFLFRECNSYNLAKTFLDKSHINVVPDAVLTFRQEIKHADEQTNKAVLCFRDDHEKVISNSLIFEITTFLRYLGYEIYHISMLDKTFKFKDISLYERDEAVKNKLREIANADIVITDRLHCMIFSVLVGTRVLAFDNCSHKVSGVYKFIDDFDNVKIANVNEDVNEQILRLLSSKINTLDIRQFTYAEFYANTIKDIISKEMIK